ncbi:mobile mystery protein B [Pilimelia anulata]|uniref:mobile mystery protein B n=1 Tax=Pilimelia anulata TaxID=53371 RepID=UPI00166B2317|nr:mobile mystery protein B [Pilimelia anulata]
MSRFAQPPGATPLELDDIEGLRPSWVTTLGDLNEAEAENVLRGRMWAAGRRAKWWYLDEAALRDLHRRLFGEVWRWAGELRRRQTNIGIEPYLIAPALRDLRDDLRVQVGLDRDGGPALPVDELVIRYHHRLVVIHPFRNGNGRLSRLAADLLMADLGGPALTWGGTDLVAPSTLRGEYLAALRRADGGDFASLLTFARR